jgi:cytochrome c556
MIRTVLAVTVLAFGVSAIVAQGDPIAARKALMKANGQAARQGAKFMKGEEPFNLAKAQAIFVAYQDSAAKVAKLGADAKDAAAKVKDEASFKAAFPEVQKNCGGCHNLYRKKPL